MGKQPGNTQLLFFAMIVLFLLPLSGCDKQSSASTSPSKSPEKFNDHSSEGSGEEHYEGDKHGGEEEGHHHDGVHLADIMQSISLRFSAIWFAGKNENVEMLDYQLEELEEAIEELEEKRPKEHGIDVYKRLDQDIVENLERLPEIVKKGNTKTFEKKYRGLTQACSSCHADAGYDFINVDIPSRNPYPNLDFSTDGTPKGQD